MLDHAGFRVTDYQRSKTFHELALAPLGIMLVMEAMGEAAAFGQEGKPFFWIEERPPAVRGGLHIAFAVEERPTVNAFHAAGLDAGGTDNGAPGLRTIYHPDYYGACILDPDGNNIEAVCRKPA